MNIKEWWYVNEKLFSFHVEISLFNLIVSINLFLIHFNIKTNLPYFMNYWVSIYSRIIKQTEHKTLEIQLTFSNNLLTGVNIYKSIHCDHTPFCIETSILGFSVIITVYDHRHWDDDNDKYE